ncbi:MAG: hypothetical protein IPJ76_01065 [Flavobacteriales bacterium]|nr:MAG: hypothetical protein IPJ76_01065 [Flavobacteriales bacterium]
MLVKLQLTLGCATVALACAGQPDSLLLADDYQAVAAEFLDDVTVINDYERLNPVSKGDSVRLCQGYACSGWVEDKHPNGVVKHRGFYQDGQLLVYKNFHPDGKLEREFRTTDTFRGALTTYHTNGQVRTLVKYFKGEVLEWEDHYTNGQVRYEQAKHKSEPWYLKMNLYQPDGKPISTLMLVDKRNNELEAKEYWPNGVLRTVGRSRFVPDRQDCVRVGIWKHFDASGKPVSEDTYVDGKVHGTRTL